MDNNNNRFSILILEKDVLEYNYYKNKFNEYAEKSKSRWHYFSRSKNEKIKMVGLSALSETNCVRP